MEILLSPSAIETAKRAPSSAMGWILATDASIRPTPSPIVVALTVLQTSSAHSLSADLDAVMAMVPGGISPIGFWTKPAQASAIPPLLSAIVAALVPFDGAKHVLHFPELIEDYSEIKSQTLEQSGALGATSPVKPFQFDLLKSTLLVRLTSSLAAPLGGRGGLSAAMAALSEEVDAAFVVLAEPVPKNTFGARPLSGATEGPSAIDVFKLVNVKSSFSGGGLHS